MSKRARKCYYGEDEIRGDRETAMLIGELLVYRYRLITREQRDAALARQRELPNPPRLGEVLLQMGLLSEIDLQEALDLQEAEENPWGQAH
jgi:hypothetical protein